MASDITIGSVKLQKSDTKVISKLTAESRGLRGSILNDTMAMIMIQR